VGLDHDNDGIGNHPIAANPEAKGKRLVDPFAVHESEIGPQTKMVFDPVLV
jgi:hypothetical protein